jgi:drug/metabolite transporter (DMT)-like permease
MFWALLSGIGACTNAAYFIVNKKFLERLDPYPLAASGFLFTSLFLLTLSFLHGFPSLGPDFFIAALATTILNIFGTILTFRALSSSDISLSIPMLSFTPLFLMGTAALILGEIPSLAGICGILIIVAGSYILNTSAEHEGLMDPFRDMVSHPGVMGMLAVAFLYAIAINFDKMVVMNSDVYFGSGFVVLMLGISFAVIAVTERYGFLPPVLHNPHPAADVIRQDHTPGSWRYLTGAGIVTGVLISLEAMAIYSAYLIQIVPYVIAIKRMSIILIVLYGTIIFREKEIVRRLAGAALMVLGAVLILAFP